MLKLEEEDIYAGIAKPASGDDSGGGDCDESSKDVRVLQPFTILDNPVDGVYSVEWTVEKPDSQFDDYVSTFTLDNKSDNKYVFTAGETTKDGVVTGHPHMSGWFTFYDSTQSTAFDLPEFTYDSETGEYSAELDGYSFSFTITEESETQVNFVGGLVYKSGVELGDFNLGFWNEPLPLTKGSFDSTTQQLTLNYDYLVEMINSSTATTSEQKSAMITLLDNQSPVIDMTTDIAEVNQYLWAFSADDQTTPAGLQIDKTTPCSLKLAFTGDSIAGFGSWQAMANYMSLVSGETVTPEAVEAMFGAFIVDDNFCTVSGTLGSFSVEFGKDEPDKPIIEKYGATVGTFLGDVDSNGVLQKPSEEPDVVFTGVKDVGELALAYAFGLGNNATRVKAKTIQFPDLTAVSGLNAMQYLCNYSSSLTSVSFPKLVTISGANAMQGAFSYCTNLTSVSFPELTTISSSGGFTSALNSCRNMTSISFPKLTTLGAYSSQSVFTSCTNLTSVSFPELTTLDSSSSQYMFNGCTALTSITFPKLSSLATSCMMYMFQGCTSLASISFPALTSTSFGNTQPKTNCMQNMLRNVTGCTVHFPSNLQSVIGSESIVTDGFGGTNTTVLFDLTATE